MRLILSLRLAEARDHVWRLPPPHYKLPLNFRLMQDGNRSGKSLRST
jgi:hypothetical protein